MSKFSKLQKALDARNYKNWQFTDLQYLIKHHGYTLERINGSHHIYIHSETKRMINIQNVKGQAKPYQVKQFHDQLS